MLSWWWFNTHCVLSITDELASLIELHIPVRKYCFFYSVLEDNYNCKKSLFQLIGILFWDLHAFFFSTIFLYIHISTQLKNSAIYVVLFPSSNCGVAETFANSHQMLLLVRRALTAVSKDIFPRNYPYAVIFKTTTSSEDCFTLLLF